jgi:hypothetical protein
MLKNLNGTVNISSYQPLVDAAFSDLERNRIIACIWKKDHTV